MRLGIGSYTYPWAVGVKGWPPSRPMGVSDLLDNARALGLRVVQIADNLPLHGLPPGGIEEIRRSAAGIEVQVGIRGLARLDEYIEITRRLGSGLLRVVVDDVSTRPTEHEIVGSLRSSLSTLDRHGITLAIENHDRFASRTLSAIIRAVDHPRVGVCLDTVNSFGALEGPAVVVEELARHTVCLHVKDFQVRRATHGLGFVVEGAPAGLGMLDLPWLLDRLAAAGRDPDAILELWTPPEADLAATIAKEAAWARDSITRLRALVPG